MGWSQTHSAPANRYGSVWYSGIVYIKVHAWILVVHVQQRIYDTCIYVNPLLLSIVSVLSINHWVYIMPIQVSGAALQKHLTSC